MRRWGRPLALCLVLFAAYAVDAATQPAELDLGHIAPDVRKAAEVRAKTLCGWSDETVAKVQEDVKDEANATAVPKAKEKSGRRMLGGGVAGPATQAGVAAKGSSVTTDPEQLAKLLCAELDVAKKLDAVGEYKIHDEPKRNSNPHSFLACMSRPMARPRVFVRLAERATRACDNIGDRLEEELEETLELEESIEAKRARARKREEAAAARIKRQEVIFGIVLVVGERFYRTRLPSARSACL